ncbi:hypothetical protein ACLMJK_007884 [Lecanora helva]
MYDHTENASHPQLKNLSPASTTESDASNSPPFTRDTSPSPTIPPTPAIFACPPLSRSFSANSSSAQSTVSGSTSSQPSTTSRSSSASTALRQRGYVRPQGAAFAPSAGNRDSVLSLGSIAHLQYYFARTGLLDGKGGQLAKEDKTKTTKPLPRIYDSPESAQETVIGVVNGDENQHDQDPNEPLMLPPTVSTYSHRVQYIPPPPDPETLRQDLKSTISDARKALQNVLEEREEAIYQEKQYPNGDLDDDAQNKTSSPSRQPSSWHEVQGIHILDVVTLAIRAAKIYYTSHEEPHRLYNIKSERQIRQELYDVLDALKKMASRNFAGGMKEEETKVIKEWLEGIDAFLTKEEAIEEQERTARNSWEWLDGSWDGRQRERERLFLSSFLAEGTLPEWTPVDAADPKPTTFLEELKTGLTLVHLHNTLLKKSKRQFGDIKGFHTDTAKPYRCAENLRYWIKAAEIRWETRLKVNVSGVVNSKDEAWLDFDAAILQWSRAVREELTREWREVPISPMQAAKELHEPRHEEQYVQ